MKNLKLITINDELEKQVENLESNNSELKQHKKFFYYLTLV